MWLATFKADFIFTLRQISVIPVIRKIISQTDMQAKTGWMKCVSLFLCVCVRVSCVPHGKTQERQGNNVEP